MVELTTAIAGIAFVVLAWLSVLRTTVIPRRSSSRMAKWTVRACVRAGSAVAGRLPARACQWVLEFCAPVSFFVLATAWLSGLALGFTLLAFAVGEEEWVLAVAAVSAAMVVAAFTAHLVTVLGAYRAREQMISRCATRVRVVTDADTLLANQLRAGSRGTLDDYFADWAGWFADVQDSHADCPGLVYLLSTGDLTWSKAALVVLDAAALVEAIAPRWAPPHTSVLLETGSACLQRLAKQMRIVTPATTISLHGREARAFDETMHLVIDAGLRAERDIHQARSAFQRARVQYAPYAVLIGSRLAPRNNDELGKRT